MASGKRHWQQADHGTTLTNLDPSEMGTLDQVVQTWAGHLPSVDHVALSVQLKLYQINLMAGRIYNRIASDFDISDVDVSVLMIIRREQDSRPIRPTDLWRRLDLRPSAMTYRLDRLAEIGLIERKPDPGDRRALFLNLTPKGVGTVNEIVRRFNVITAEKLAELGTLGGSVSELDKQLDFYLRAWSAGPE